MKEQLYKTARATLGCVHFKAGEFVSVRWQDQRVNGTNWYLIDRTEKGKLENPVAYPEYHLAEFCL